MAMTRKKKRLAMLGGAGAVLALAVVLIFVSLKDTVAFFHFPTEFAEKKIEPGRNVRLGGMVKKGSVVRGEGTKITFVVADDKNSLPVTYVGILPDLFREGQGVVAEGKLGEDGVFRADRVLAKHDENYTPREIAELKEKGVWEGKDKKE